MSSIFNNNTESERDGLLVDSHNFFDILKGRLEDLNLIDESLDQDRSKIAITRAYPDVPYEQNNVVVYQVLSSKPSSNGGNLTQGRISSGPKYSHETYDYISGNVEDVYIVSQVHVIELVCFSVSGETCNNMSRMIESFFITQSSILRRHVPSIRHLQTTLLTLVGDYDGKRLFSKSVVFEIKTKATYTTDLEQLKNINYHVN